MNREGFRGRGPVGPPSFGGVPGRFSRGRFGMGRPPGFGPAWGGVRGGREPFGDGGGRRVQPVPPGRPAGRGGAAGGVTVRPVLPR
ncbi:MAG: hypothetical protein ACKPHU_29485 [Planctomycetaceae bacterium]